MWTGTKSILTALLILGAGATSTPARADLQNATMSVDNAQRQYLIYAPIQPSTAPHPVIVLLHGHGGSAAQLMGLGGRAAPFRPWLQIAARIGAVLIVPNGTVGADGKRGWNDLRGVATNPKTDDMAFVRALVRKATRQHQGDPEKVYLVGISNGGHMALRTALEAPELVAGIGVVAAAMPAKFQTSTTAKPLSVVFMNGTRDRLMPYAGGDMVKGRGTVLSTQDSVRFWVRANQCADGPDSYRYDNGSRKDRSRVIRSLYENCSAGVRVALFEVRGAGHSTPSLSERYRPAYLMLTGRQNWDIEAAEEIWGVFASALPTPPAQR